MSRRSLAHRPLARGYATAQKKAKTLARAAQPDTPATAKKPSPAPAGITKKASAKTSSQGMVEAMRKEQAAQQKKDALEKQKENTEEQDAAAHTDYMNRVSKQAPSLDLWSQAEMDVLGTTSPFVYLVPLSFALIDLVVPVRNQAPWGLKNVRWYWDNLREVSKSAMAYVPPLTATAAHTHT